MSSSIECEVRAADPPRQPPRTHGRCRGRTLDPVGAQGKRLERRHRPYLIGHVHQCVAMGLTGRHPGQAAQ